MTHFFSPVALHNASNFSFFWSLFSSPLFTRAIISISPIYKTLEATLRQQYNNSNNNETTR